jgi:putative transposase
MESAIGLFKTELIDRHPTTWRDRFDVEKATARWVRWFSNTRIHSKVGYLLPTWDASK